MRKTRDFLLGKEGEAHVYHIVSRVVGRLHFGVEEKEVVQALLFKQIKFSGLKLLAWCVMGDHFHLLLEVPDKAKALAGMSVEELLGRLSVLRKEYTTGVLLEEIAELRKNGDSKALAELSGTVGNRLFDLSKFMKELKLKITLTCNKMLGRRGTFWEGVFNSVLVEQGEAVRVVAAYIDLNPVRAGLVKEPGDYRWSSYGAAVKGMSQARRGLAQAVTGDATSRWPRVDREYRRLLVGREDREGKKGDSAYSVDEIRKMREEMRRIPLTAALRCRVRYFTDGVALGSQEFVDQFFEERPGEFGSRRKDGGRKMQGAKWGDLRALRDLRIDPLTLPGGK